MKSELLKKCRYYHGENESPFVDDQNKDMLWEYERAWVLQAERGLSPADSDMLQVYDYYKLSSLDTYAPKSLLALLFNRYAKGAWSMSDAVEPFKSFIKEYYKK